VRIFVEGLVKNYGKVRALNGLSFSVGEEVFGLIGPNGAGKSTTIKVLLGLIKADEGRVNILGYDPWKEGLKIKRKLGVLHEKPSFPHWLTGEELLTYLARVKGLENPKSEVREMLQVFGLYEHVQKRIGEYSAGMVQRLGLAQAFLGNPEIIILDEPTANLDPVGRSEVLNLIRKRFEERKATVLISTHILSELERVCDSVAIIHKGRVLEAGAVEMLGKKYFEEFYELRTSKNQIVWSKISELNYVKNPRIVEDKIIFSLESDSYLYFQEDLLRILRESRVKLKSFSLMRPNLEDIYKKVMASG